MIGDRHYTAKQLMTVTIYPYMRSSDNPHLIECVNCGLCDEQAVATTQELHDRGWKWQHLPYDCERVCPACSAAGKLMAAYDENDRRVKPKHVIERAT